MNNQKQILRSFVAMALLATFFFSLGVQIFHSFEDHDHFNVENSEQYHKTTPDCGLFHFQLNSLHFDISTYSEFILFQYPRNSYESMVSLVLNPCFLNNKQLRAPPVIA
ncbi:hypothetical protein HX109_11345 [Galbibacter sp. BG1]|uniref:hypothetical protein n=1 Tax=Galbibacter sp. BG1 TaxID=1170699 RepID=UPI0015BBE88F|nr:hypothetical protein [Galbibacter sp. BG1]QLE02117.1 hypothetical protein HX109_11345 [Galbibacter sp. BG1]